VAEKQRNFAIFYKKMYFGATWGTYCGFIAPSAPLWLRLWNMEARVWAAKPTAFESFAQAIVVPHVQCKNKVRLSAHTFRQK